ncbi:Fibronectin type III domain protein [Leptothrix cholodnii SP-6]|uniref:Fibronectin type III domain protein n=1 Tax=Leptothrix cholodnii (strain ATCC 51168 / LMG 8142 / SP-6) TaxID=395495 RepID=B1Y7E0_LEPCP|nr:fibronectin type III domain-containing protein [Leptothrix cholodnii]ACB34895.1 Fibronectin type III domain protein [Leptothrix cholodnii SP-6]
MQRKLIVALVASALELYAASVSAQSMTCTQPFTTGPLNPVNGYAETVTDINGISLQICKDPAMCFFDPVVTGNLTSEQAGTGGESFWWLANATLANNSGLDAVLVMAAEATYNTEDPTPGEQLSFTRLRLRIDAPFTGVYTVEYPYGRESFNIELLDAGDEIREVFDISFTPNMLSNTPATGRVGPWLRWTGNDAPAGFIGDGNTPHAVTGSPCGQNYFRITAVDVDGTPLPIGGFDAQGQPINVVETDLFTVQGQLSDNKVQTPLASDRISYARTAGGTQVDAFAVSGAATGVEMRDFVTTTGVSSPVLAAPVALQKETNGSAFSKSQGLVNAPATLPAAMELHGSDATGTTDTTRLVRALTDSVVISQADYNPLTGKLLVLATSSDKVANPALTIEEFGVATGTELDVGGVPPATVTVLSAAGGKETVKVRVTVPQSVIAPNGVAASLLTPTSVQVSWTDRSDNETGFEVVRKVGAVTTVVGTPGAANAAGNELSFVDTTAPDDTLVSYSVRSVLGAEKAESAFSNEVLVPIAAPTLNSVSPVAGNTSTNLRLSWTGSAKAVSYNVYRDNALIRNVTGLTYDDIGLTPSTTYSYRVEAVGANSSTTSNSISGSTTAGSLLNAPTNLAVVAGVTAARPRVIWGDASQGETGYRVSRAAVNVTTLVAGTATVANLAANTTSFSSPALTAQTLYQFTVNAVNGAEAGAAASIYHYQGNLPVARTVRATVRSTGAVANRTPLGQVPVTWQAPATTTAGYANVLGYEVQYCVGASTTCTWTGLVTKTGVTNVNHTYTGLANTLHSFRVRSITAAGFGSAWSVVSATPR